MIFFHRSFCFYFEFFRYIFCTGSQLKKLEKEKGIILRFVIGHSATPGGVLDRAIDREDAEHEDFLRLEHLEGYPELSTKTRVYFATAVSLWNADFYVKVDDDVHVNLGELSLNTLVLLDIVNMPDRYPDQ